MMCQIYNIYSLPLIKKTEREYQKLQTNLYGAT
jgi:hypothetical protein